MNFAIRKIDFTDATAVWRRNSRVYLRLWKTELIAPIIEPIFTFFAFGFGVGGLVTSEIQGLSYLQFVGAGVLTFTVLMRTVFEMTYGAYFRMVYQSTYDAILATPVNAESLAFGEIIWAVTKGVVDCFFILPLIVIFGSATSLFTPLSVVPLIFGCFYLGGLGLAITARILKLIILIFSSLCFFRRSFYAALGFRLRCYPVGCKYLLILFQRPASLIYAERA